MKLNTFLLLIVVLVTAGCSGNKSKKEVVYINTCCLDSISYNLVDSSFLSSASIILKLTNCDTLRTANISSAIFPYVKVNDSSYFNLWAAGIESAQSPNTVYIYIYTNNFENSNLSKDSIEHILSQQVGIVTSRGDTIYVEPCR